MNEHNHFRQRGFGLVELMIALVLGLMVIGGASSVFLSNKQAYRSNSALSQVQESSRIAFELLARDIRQAGLSACGNTRVANTLNNPAGCWWCGFTNAVLGFEDDQSSAVAFGSGDAARVNGTDAIQLMGISDMGLTITGHQPTSARFFIDAPTGELQGGDIIMVCDPDHAAIMQISNYNSSNVTVVHNTGNSTVPGNCNVSLNFPTVCTTNCTSAGGGNCYEFGANSTLAKMTAMEWYIGNNPQGGRSLYQLTLGSNAAGNAVTNAQEMVRNITNLQLQYLWSGNYVDADTAGIVWAQVTAVRLTLDMEGAERFTGTDGEKIAREYTASVTVRNRVN